MAGPERDDERFTPELDFVATIEEKVQEALYRNALRDITDNAYPGTSVAANAHPTALLAYAAEEDAKASAAKQAVERNGWGNRRDLNERRLAKAKSMRFLEESREGIEAARDVLQNFRNGAAELKHSTVFPRAKDVTSIYSEDLSNARLPFHLRETLDGSMLLAETAAKIQNLGAPGVLSTPKSVAQKGLLPILDGAIREADARIASLEVGTEIARTTLKLMDQGSTLRVQQQEHETRANNVRSAADDVREVWAEAMHHEANMPADLRSGGLDVPHPTTFTDERALDSYISEVAEAAKADVAININLHPQPSNTRGAEGQGLA